MSVANMFDKTSIPRIMGILNTTPDSFSDGGNFNSVERALRHAQLMIEDGADIIDVGGESTRPGAQKVSLSEELERTIPVIEKLASNFDVQISIDTSKPQVMHEAMGAGASIINDVRALQAPGAVEIAAQTNAEICLMHMQGQPDTMQNAPEYANIFDEIRAFFVKRLDECTQAGIDISKIYLDPGFGFGKTLQHNFQLLANLNQFDELNCPLLIGLSRKSMIGNLLEQPVDKRLAGSLAGVMLAAMQGVKIVRVHDVRESADVLNILKKTAESICD